MIVDPISIIPVFLGMTPHDTAAERRHTASLACWIMAGVLIGFALLGNWIFRVLGITLPAFQIAGSIVLLLVALDMLQARLSRVQHTPGESAEGAEKEDIAVTPLAVPLLAGPGAISTVLLLHNTAKNLAEQFALLAAIGAVVLVTYLILRFAAGGAPWLKPIALRITARLMGLLLAAVACQFMIQALRTLKIIPP